MVRLIDAPREAFGVEPISAVLPIAPSTHYETKARERDATLMPAIRRVWGATRRRYGAKKAWKELRREGVLRGRRRRWAVVAEAQAHRPQDLVQRNVTATRPNQLWASDVTHVALDALVQALHDRALDGALVHHSDRGVQYLAIRYTDPLLEAGIDSSVGR